MITGGYQILNFDGIAFNTSGTLIPNSYFLLDKINKTILISGLKIGSTKYKDCFTVAEKVGSNYVFSAYGYKFTVLNTNYISASLETNSVYEHSVYIKHQDGPATTDDVNKVWFSFISKSATEVNSISTIISAINKNGLVLPASGYNHGDVSLGSYACYPITNVTIGTNKITCNLIKLSTSIEGRFDMTDTYDIGTTTENVTVTDTVRTI